MANMVHEDADAFIGGVNGKTFFYRPGDTVAAAHEVVARSGTLTPVVGSTPTGQIIIVPKDQKRGSLSTAAGFKMRINGAETVLPVGTAFTPAAGVLAFLAQAGIIYRTVTS